MRSSGEEVPATIVGAGTIFGTEGDDVIVGSAGNDVVFAGGGNDIVCGEGGNDILDGGTGNDVLIGDELDSAPFAPSNGANNDTLLGELETTRWVASAAMTLGGRTRRRRAHRFRRCRHHRRRARRRHRIRRSLDDQMSGGPDNDTLFGNFGSDVISGGPAMTSSTATTPSHRRLVARRSRPVGTTTPAAAVLARIVQNCEAAA